MRFWFGRLTGSDLELGVFLDEPPESQFRLDLRSELEQIFVLLVFLELFVISVSSICGSLS
jgi:hypothetical protein